jgi:hypothetical protein
MSVIALTAGLFISAAWAPLAAHADSPAPTCSSLGVRLSDDKTVYVFTATATASTPSKITGYTFTYGDNQSYTFTFASNSKSDRHTATVTHSYQTAGTFAASVRVNLKISGKTSSVTAASCKTSVTVPPAGTDLPATGAGLPVGLAAGVAVIAGGLHALGQRRRVASL